ncbi:MAG TPA: response regulator transcription factor [Acetobacteraceae bacterium]|nr:response regulator transcription factor [Acetobacteraceae bacterium]
MAGIEASFSFCEGTESGAGGQLHGMMAEPSAKWSSARPVASARGAREMQMGAKAEIVVVDDEPALRESVSEYLSRQGFGVRAVSNGAELRAALADRSADVLVLDLSMPGEDGLSIARSIRAGPLSDIGIVMLTAAGDVVDRVVGLEIGADDYVTKPFDPRELLARLRALLRRREAARSIPPATPDEPAPGNKVVRMGRNSLDLDARRLTGPDGSEIQLHASEFALLRAFAERPGRVLSRETLLDLAHPRGEEHFDRSIDVRITRIRRKIEAIPERPEVIKTVRGVGYVFDPKAER